MRIVCPFCGNSDEVSLVKYSDTALFCRACNNVCGVIEKKGKELYIDKYIWLNRYIERSIK